MIPKDPMILLSYVNTQLRDYYDSLEAPVSYTHLCQYSERFLIEVNCNVDTAIYKWKPTRRTEWKIIVRSPNKKYMY